MTLRRHILLPVLLILTAGVFGLSVGNDFVNLDDPLLVSENTHVQERSAANVGYVLTHFDPELYIPVTFLTYQAETWILGPAPWHYHLFNLLLHLGSVALVYLIALGIARAESVAIITAALFALHPVNAEAVLWISARKDLLSSFFAFGSLAAYLGWRRDGNGRLFALSLGLFLLALGSKVSVVGLPLILLAYEYGNGNLRTSWKRLAPFFGLAVLFGVIAIVGKAYVESKLDPVALVIMGFRTTFFYLSQLAAPSGLSASHLLGEHAALRSPLLPLAIVAVAGLMILAWKSRKRVPGFAAGTTFFFLAIAPSLIHYTQGNGTLVLGAERYLYLASAGAFFAVASLLHAALARVSVNVRRFVLVTGTLFLLVLAYLTVIRVLLFADSVIFNIDILQKSPENSRAWYNLGAALEDARKPMQAEASYLRALDLEPHLAEAAISLGVLFLREGRTEEGIAMLEKATVIRPDYYKGYFNLGVALQNLKRYAEAEAAYRKTLERFPDYPEAHRNLAVVLGLQKKVRESMAEYEILAGLDPSFRAELEALKASR